MQPLQKDNFIYQNLFPKYNTYYRSEEPHILVLAFQVLFTFGWVKSIRGKSIQNYVQGKERHADDLYRMQSEQE
jgi:hypothetical protein